jgi:hypothetical protein
MLHRKLPALAAALGLLATAALLPAPSAQAQNVGAPARIPTGVEIKRGPNAYVLEGNQVRWVDCNATATRTSLTRDAACPDTRPAHQPSTDAPK